MPSEGELIPLGNGWFGYRAPRHSKPPTMLSYIMEHPELFKRSEEIISMPVKVVFKDGTEPVREREYGD